MTSVKPHQTEKSNLRRVNALRDMPTILDLIEIGFKSELDPQGWKMLNQMRNITNQAALLRMRGALRSESGGFVWVEDGEVVANLSLRLAAPSVTRGRLIGNVVVHPHFRGQGIGHALVEVAVRTARDEGARWIGLEVRQQNKVACDLYRNFGFRVVGSVLHMLRGGELPWPDHITLNIPWRRSKPQDKVSWLALADSVHGHYQKRVLEIRDYQFAYGGLNRAINLWLIAQRESAWINDSTTPRCAVCAKTDRRYRFHVWDLLLKAGESEAGAREVVAKALSISRHLPPWTVIAVVANQDPLLAALQDTGFHLHRTLLQMVLEL